jgi:hypothetical protein
MNEERYFDIKTNADHSTFIFASEGRHGTLTKIVRFREVTGADGTFNLALGTVLPNGEADFDTLSNNGDRNKVLRTVVEIISEFLMYYPDRRVYITGSDDRRTLLYKRAIIYGYDEVIKRFVIYGDTSSEYLLEEDFEIFNPNKDYSGFLIEQRAIIDE